MRTITIELSEYEYARLTKLAESRGTTPEACLRRLAQSVQPGGSGWVAPGVVKKKEGGG